MKLKMYGVRQALLFSCCTVSKIPFIYLMYLPNIMRDFKDPTNTRILSFCNLLPVPNSMLSVTFIFLNVSCRQAL